MEEKGLSPRWLDSEKEYLAQYVETPQEPSRVSFQVMSRCVILIDTLAIWTIFPAYSGKILPSQVFDGVGNLG